MIMSKKKEKLRAQVKSRFYYLFWGAATVSVFAGQIYVGTGYRQLSNTLNDIFESVSVMRGHKMHPMIVPPLERIYE